MPLGGENGSVARFFNSSPPLTGLSPLPHDWQRQAGGGRPAGRKPSPELARIRRRRHTEGLAEMSLTEARGLPPAPPTAEVMCRHVALSGQLLTCCSTAALLHPQRGRGDVLSWCVQLSPQPAVPIVWLDFSMFGAKDKHYLAIISISGVT